MAWRFRPFRSDPDPAPPAAELARAARLLRIRARREAGSALSGAWASAFRGGGMEFHESRPYVPGDDVRTLDWNAVARTGEPFVKVFREERDLRLLLAMDHSASMGFGTCGASKARTAAHAAALLAAAAGGAGDEVGLLAFTDRVEVRLAPARGARHLGDVVRAASAAGEAPGRGTRLQAALEGLRPWAAARSVCVLLSDFRDPALVEVTAGLAGLSRRSEIVCAVLHDPAEERLERVGSVRLRDPERPGRVRRVATGRARIRTRHRLAWAARSRSLEASLVAAGCEVLWLRTDRDPLRAWMHFFRRRAARLGGRP